MDDARGGRVVVLAHCLLNANTRVHGIAGWSGAHSELVGDLMQRGVGIVQLPCPEVGYLGMKRWVASREQYDVDAYRRYVRALLEPVADGLVELQRDGVIVEAVVGVAGSPSCGALETSEGFVGGRVEGGAESHRVAGSGVLVQEFAAMLAERGVSAPFYDAPRAPVVNP